MRGPVLLCSLLPFALLGAGCGGASRADKAAAPVPFSPETVACLEPVGQLVAPGRRNTLQFPTPPSDDPSGVRDLGIEWLAILKLHGRGGNARDLHIARTYARADARFLAGWGEGGTVFTRGVTKDITRSFTRIRVIRHPERRGVQAGIYALFWSAPPTARQSAAVVRCLDQKPSPRVTPDAFPPPHT